MEAPSPARTPCPPRPHFTKGYERLKFDYPADRILRITISRPEKYKRLGHHRPPGVDLCLARGGRRRRQSTAWCSPARARRSQPAATFGMIEKMTTDYRTLANTWKEGQGPGVQPHQLRQADHLLHQRPGGGAPAWWRPCCATSPSPPSRSSSPTDTPAWGVAAGDHAVILWPLALRHGQGQILLDDLRPDARRGGRAHRPAVAGASRTANSEAKTLESGRQDRRRRAPTPSAGPSTPSTTGCAWPAPASTHPPPSKCSAS